MELDKYVYHDVRELGEDLIGRDIWIQGRLHRIRSKGKMTFILLRYQTHLLQAVGRKNELGDEQYKLLTSIPVESVISLFGRLNKSPFEIESTTYKTIEFVITGWRLESKALSLPFQIDDANDFGESFRSDVGQDIRLDNRWLDLRVPVNNCIFKLQSTVSNLFRQFLISQNFVEIHSPKLIGAASEGGASVFGLPYFEGKDAFLAQSPQLYKQMAINADFDRVFEVAPVFRAEKAFTTRHLCEYISLDLEMTISPDQTYYEILFLMWRLLDYIFDGLLSCEKELSVIREKLPFEPLTYPKDPLIIDFREGVKLLNEKGFQQDPFEDLSTANERELGKIVKEKYASDLFILDKYPLKARPFYTMPFGEYSLSYDVIMRGQEISSGSQRVNDYEMLVKRIKDNEINMDSLLDYVNSFSHGSKRHGGCAFGLERIVMLYLDLDNVRKTSFCPRDPKRLFP